MAEIKITAREQDGIFSTIFVAAMDESDNTLSKGRFTMASSGFCNTFVKAMLPRGIATPVENRRGGLVRQMFDHMHALAVEEDVAVSILHPFSFSYYNKFGYEKVADHLIVRFPTRMIDFVPRQCRFVPYESRMLPDMISVYDQFAKGRNLLLSRFDDRYYKDKKTYICYDGDLPIAYVVFSTSKTLYINNFRDTLLTVNEMAYTSPAGLREIFSFLRMFEGEFDEIELRDLSLYSEAELLLRHYTHTKYAPLPDLSVKILNTKAMLCANDYPQNEGEFTVKIIDSLPTTAGTYKVSYGGGDSKVSRLADTADADVTLPAGAFARLIYGYDPLTADSLRYMEGVEITNPNEDIFRAFPKRPCGIFEHF